MLGFLNSRLSLWSRVGLVAACAAPPITLLLYLFIGQTMSQARFTDLELRGAAYIAQVWSAFGPVVGKANAPPEPIADQTCAI